MKKKISIDWGAIIRVIVLLVIVLCVFLMFKFCSSSAADEKTEVTYTKLDTSGEGWKPFEINYIIDDKYVLENTIRYPLDYSSYITAYESDALKMDYSDKDGSIVIYNKITGDKWTSSVDFNEKNLKKVKNLWQMKLSSPLILNVYDVNNNKGISEAVYPHTQYTEDGNTLKSETKIKVEAIDNGFYALFAFEQYYIQIGLKVYMQDDELHVEIPQDSIIESGNYRLVSTEVYPMLGCVEASKTDGYVFYPDGSGAISTFTSETVREQESIYQWKIYGETSGEKQRLGEDDADGKRVSYDSILDSEASGVKATSLPVFGIRESTNKALFAIIDQGSGDAVINYVPSGYVIEINRIYCTFTYRRAIDLSVINSGGITSGDTDAAKFETDIQNKQAAVVYKFLTGDEADYSGMANAYRRYLLKNELIKDYVSGSNIEIGIDIFMGIYEEQTLADNFVEMTTFEQAQEIYEDLKAKLASGIGIQSALYGWQKNGYGRDPLASKAASQLGGNNGLKDLIAYTSSNSIKLALTVNPVDLNEEYGSFTARNEAAYTSAGIALYSRQNSLYARNLATMFGNYMPSYVKFITDITADAQAETSSVALNIERLGSYLYIDYNENSAKTREESKLYIEEQLKAIAEQKVGYWSEANYYMIANTSRIENLAYDHSQYDISTRAVPFYQMVVHGYIPYSSTPGNLSHNLNWMELKWAEYGYMPYFMLSYNNALELKYTDANWLYSCVYSQWGEVAIEVANRMQEKLGVVWDSTMKEHTQLATDVFKVEYENGKIVYVNYTDAEVAYDGVTIPAADYVVV